MAGWWRPSTVSHAGPGISGVGASFLSDVPAAALLVEASPAAEPEFIPDTPSVETPISQTLPTVISPEVPLITLSKVEPRPEPPSVNLSKSTRRPHAATTSSGNANGVRKSAVGTNGSGAGLAGLGSGGGGPGYMPPQFRIRYKPPYPEQARAQRLEGMVLLLVQVDADGRVVNAGIRQSCGHAVLDRAALESVRSWRFLPARQNGAAIAAQVEVPINFRFEERRTART